MLSYKQYRALNESVMPTFTLGIAQPTNLGISSPFGVDESKMAKKMSKKKMNFGDEEEDDTGDGEMVPPSSDKDSPDVDVDLGDDKEDGCKMCGAKSKKTSKKKMWSDKDDDGGEDDEEHEDDDDGDEGHEDNDEDSDEDEESGEDLADKGALGPNVGGGVGGGGPMFSKKSKKKCGADMDDKDDDDGDDDEEMDDKGKDKEMFFSKKKSKKNLKKEATDEEKWWNSVHSMTGPAPDTKYGDGWTEYQTGGFTPIDTENLTQAVRPEPEAGQVGFAPQKAMGSFFG
jgi:hypothetical protein